MKAPPKSNGERDILGVPDQWQLYRWTRWRARPVTLIALGVLD